MSAEALVNEPKPNKDIIPKALHDAEVIDFSDASVEIVTETFLSQLRDPLRSYLHGPELAEFIDSELQPKPDSETFALESRLARLVADEKIFEVYEEKIERDVVFRKLFELQQGTKDQARELATQRHAGMGLLKLRSIDVRDETPDDADWEEVIDRLFGQ